MNNKHLNSTTEVLRTLQRRRNGRKVSDNPLNPKFTALLQKEIIEMGDLAVLDDDETAAFYTLLEEMMLQKEGDELDDFRSQVHDLFMPQDCEQLWERNQARIACAIAGVISDHGRAPTQTELAELTRLSRRTIQTHFEEAPYLRTFCGLRTHYQGLAFNLMDKLFADAYRGDVKAARLYFERTDRLEAQNERTRTIANSFKAGPETTKGSQ